MPNFSRFSISDIKNRQKNSPPLVCISAYTYPIAKIIDDYCDIILVGDSVGMSIYGMKNTLEVTVDMMINHGKAVVSATKKSMIIVDLPYGSYEKSANQAYETAAKIMDKTGCNAVKLETPANMAKIVEFLVKKNIPVIGHVGLMPQYIKDFKDYKFQGRDAKQGAQIVEDAMKIADAGAFGVVIEGVVQNIAETITEKLSIPTIGIGASFKCDGQVLVIDDILGINQEFKPRFVKHYADLAEQIRNAAQSYASEVTTRQFPSEKHCFNPSSDKK